MNEIKELHQIIELLRKYNLPVSPILEYAINEKIEQLSFLDESPVIKSVFETQEKDFLIGASVKTSTRTKKKPSVLKVVRANGTIIVSEKSADTFCQVIKEIGVEKIYSLKIPMDSMLLVTKGGNPHYPTAQHDIGTGFFVNTHSNTVTKKRQLERIFKACNLKWKVEITE